ncbi:MAG: hypothetical protein ACTIMJ_07890 [Weissella hellenica]|uniref:hypothetical protein n=1 Tax=Weissella hellenica TaxID=46256 RepID=UPI0038889115
MFRKERDVERILLDILYDLIDAQNNGQTAENYFGKQPKIFADEIIRTLPNSFIEAVKLAVYILFVYILFFTIPGMLIPSANFDLGNLVILGVLIFIFSIGSLWLIGQATYATNKLQKNLIYIVCIVIFIILVAVTTFLI